MECESGSGRWRVGLLALMVLLVLGMAGEALVPAVTAAERGRGREERGAGRLAELEAFRGQARRGEVNAEVVGGQPVAQGTFTFMTFVLISAPGGGTFLCGGSLIDALYVLTAAHCVEDPAGNEFDPDDFALVIGKADWTTFESENVRGVVEVTQHPDWDPETSGNENDVAVLELTSPVPASVAKPLPVVEAGETRFDGAGQAVTVAGWGTTSSGGSGSDRLRAANLTIVSDASCDAAYTSFVQAVMVCAAFQGRDSCQGDSGGPLFAREVIGFDVKKKKKKKGKGKKKIRIPIHRDVQMGIVSFGEGCADPDFPGVYTRLSAPGINEFIIEMVDS